MIKMYMILFSSTAGKAGASARLTEMYRSLDNSRLHRHSPKLIIQQDCRGTSVIAVAVAWEEMVVSKPALYSLCQTRSEEGCWYLLREEVKESETQ